MKKVRVTAAVKSGVLAVNWLSIFSATNESRRILDATLTPVIIFFAPQPDHLFTKAGTYSQVAPCVPLISASPFARLS